MPTTSNKGYEVQATGSNTGTWGETLNGDVITIIDNNLGGITSKTLSASNVTLSTAESQSAILRLTGTLLADVQITTEAIGFFFVENLTSGSFSVTVRNDQVATAVTVAQGLQTLVTSDATNGCRIGASPFPAGTKMLFRQTSAPVGWTKDTTYTDAALRLTSGTISQQNTAGKKFSDYFAARTITQAMLPNVTLSGSTNTTGNHTHTIGNAGGLTGRGTGSASAADSSTATTSTAGNHSHTVTVSLGGSGSSFPFDVNFVDVIIATKD